MCSPTLTPKARFALMDYFFKASWKGDNKSKDNAPPPSPSENLNINSRQEPVLQTKIQANRFSNLTPKRRSSLNIEPVINVPAVSQLNTNLPE